MTTQSPTKIGFCGLGAMGYGMATHLLSHPSSPTVSAFDLYPPALSRFSAAGGTPAPSLAASATDASIYIVMVATAAQAHPVLFGAKGVVAELPKGGVLVLCSTVASRDIQGIEKNLAQVGRGDILLVDAPVSGGAARAAAGELSIMVGGSVEAVEKARWVLEALSAKDKLFIVDGGIGMGSNMKMVHQVLAAVHILAVSEAYGLGARMGIAGRDVFERVKGGPGDEMGEAWSWMFEHRSPRVLEQDYFPGVSALNIILKDTSIITSTARTIGFPTTLCSIAEQVYFAAADRGWGGDDDAGIVRLWTPDAVAAIKSTLSDNDQNLALDLIVDLLVGIHIVAAAEAITLANHVGVPLQQLYTLACDAAGGSTMFRRFGTQMIALLSGDDESSRQTLEPYVRKLKDAVAKMQELRCPSYLGSGALNVLARSGPNFGLRDLLKCYGAK